VFSTGGVSEATHNPLIPPIHIFCAGLAQRAQGGPQKSFDLGGGIEFGGLGRANTGGDLFRTRTEFAGRVADVVAVDAFEWTRKRGEGTTTGTRAGLSPASLLSPLRCDLPADHAEDLTFDNLQAIEP